MSFTSSNGVPADSDCPTSMGMRQNTLPSLTRSVNLDTEKFTKFSSTNDLYSRFDIIGFGCSTVFDISNDTVTLMVNKKNSQYIVYMKITYDFNGNEVSRKYIKDICLTPDVKTKYMCECDNCKKFTDYNNLGIKYYKMQEYLNTGIGLECYEDSETCDKVYIGQHLYEPVMGYNVYNKDVIISSYESVMYTISVIENGDRTIHSYLYEPTTYLQSGDCRTTYYKFSDKFSIIYNDGDVQSVVLFYDNK